MKNNFCPPEFFLGANTPYGFFSIFNQLYTPGTNWFCHILKGGPGTGKSTLMKNVAEKASKKKIKHEIIRCSSDPESLDAVILTDLNKCIVDGTAPHVIDPTYPGISDEIINLGEFWDSKALKEKEKIIIPICKENSKLHQMSKHFLATFGYAYNEISRLVQETINLDKLNNFCKSNSKKLIKKISSENKNEKLRFISSVTPKGYIFLSETLESLCEKIFIIDDPYSTVGNIILQNLRLHALNLNYEVISCPSPFLPAQHIEALLLPDIKLGFAVKNQFLPQDTFKSLKAEYKIIHTKRFLNKEKLLINKNLIKFNSKICKEFLRESSNALFTAKKIHDEIESIYSASMNYSKVNKITQKLLHF